MKNNNLSKKRPSIPQHTILELWSKSGGRCQFKGCNIPLWKDGLTCTKLNTSNIAHIISWTPTGPRGDINLSHKLAQDISNLMLTCQKHNKVIDSHKYIEEYPIERLLNMKKEHEGRILAATSIQPENQSTMIIYSATTGKHAIHINENEARTALMPNFYPSSQINLNMINSNWEDKDSKFWEIEKDNLKGLVEKKIIPGLKSKDIKHMSFFAFAPQPLLIYLGSLLPDIYAADVYQLHRNPQTWKWSESYETNFNYIIDKPEDLTGIPALTFSLSADITKDRIKNVIKEPTSVWNLTIDNPDKNYLTSQKQLYQFSEVTNRLLDEIKAIHGQQSTLHVFPAMPIATALELGRIISPKATMPIKLYDQNNHLGGFIHAFDLDIPVLQTIRGVVR